MKMIIKIIRAIAVFILLLGAIYLLGPRVETPVFDPTKVTLDVSFEDLPLWIEQNEKKLGNVRPGNVSKIIFNDSIPQRTKYSVVYLHGFTASGKEGEPVHQMIAKAMGANLYIPRLYGHGLDEQEPMLEFNNDAYWTSGKQAIAIAKLLGEQVIVLGTSHGGALALSLADDTDIAALALFGPNVAVFDPTSKLLSKPWGLQIARAVKGGNYHYMFNPSEEKKKFWTTKTRLESLTHMQKFLDIKMRKATFNKVKVPVFLGYYYKNDSLQDDVVSVPAMLRMFDQLGTPNGLKMKRAFPETGDHVITSYITTDYYEEVVSTTIAFLKSHLQ